MGRKMGRDREEKEKMVIKMRGGRGDGNEE